MSATPPPGFAYTDLLIFADPGFNDENPDRLRIMLECDQCFGLVMWSRTGDHLAWHEGLTPPPS